MRRTRSQRNLAEVKYYWLKSSVASYSLLHILYSQVFSCICTSSAHLDTPLPGIWYSQFITSALHLGVSRTVLGLYWPSLMLFRLQFFVTFDSHSGAHSLKRHYLCPYLVQGKTLARGVFWWQDTHYSSWQFMYLEPFGWWCRVTYKGRDKSGLTYLYLFKGRRETDLHLHNPNWMLKIITHCCSWDQTKQWTSIV